MKLNQEQIQYIENIVRTGNSIGIDNIIIEPDMVRAIDDIRTVVMFHTDDVLEMPFGSIGLNRVSGFLSRLEIAKTQDKFYMEVIVDTDDEYARSVTMRALKTKIDYRCANPATIQAPRVINDELVYRIQLNPEAVSLMQKGQSAMSADIVSLIGDESGVSFEMTDINNDAFRHKFTTEIEIIDEDAGDNFSHRYPVKTILALFKQSPEGQFDIGKKGILNINVNGLDIYVLPQV